MRTIDATTPTIGLEDAMETFLCLLEGRNRSEGAIRAYRTDLAQFIAWLRETDITIATPAHATRSDIGEYLAHLARRKVSGVSRARTLSAIRAFFRHLVAHDQLAASPAAGVETPRREKAGRTYLRPDEYTKLLSLAGANPRDYAILQTFLQTGVRVSELCALRLEDIDLVGRTLTVTGKGMVTRTIELEKKGVLALRSYLAVRPAALSDRLFLNRYGEPLGERGVRTLVAAYLRQAGIAKKASPHSLRHTFATYKAERGVSPFVLKEWLGHARLDTTQIYVHLGRQNAKKAMEATSL
jgi:integrase/recombinase XerC